MIGLAAALGGGVAGLLAGDPRAVVETEQAVATAEHAGLGWLARVGRAALSIAGAPAGAEYARSDATAVREAAARDEDRWGEGLAALAEGWAAMREPEAALEPLEAATARFRALGAGSLEAWARGLTALALARAGAPEAREAARAAEAVGRSTGIAVVAAVAQRALAELDPFASGELGLAADGILAEAGRRSCPRATDPSPPARMPTGGPSRRGRPELASASGGVGAGSPVRVVRDDRRGSVDRSLGLKPRPRAVLRFLALNAGRPVHREVLQETFWPEADPETGARSLHVALSALRRELDAARRAGRLRAAGARRGCLPARPARRCPDRPRRLRASRRRGADRPGSGSHAGRDRGVPGRGLPRTAATSCRRTDRRNGRRSGASARGPRPSRRPGRSPSCCSTAIRRGRRRRARPAWPSIRTTTRSGGSSSDARERAGDQAAATSARSGYARMLAELGVIAVDDA